MNPIKLVTMTVLLGVVLVIFASSTTTVKPGERGVVLRLDKVDRVLSNGFHWKAPFIEDVVTFDVKTRKIEVDSTAASSDLQTVTTTIALNYNLDPSAVGALLEQTGLDYKIKIIDPAIQESVKSATALFTAEQRTKEIGIRKSIGAKTSQVMALLTKKFLGSVILSFCIASVIAYYGMQIWLEDFAYRTSIGWEVFVATGSITVVIALLTVSWQAYKAANRNPVESLRYE